MTTNIYVGNRKLEKGLLIASPANAAYHRLVDFGKKDEEKGKEKVFFIVENSIYTDVFWKKRDELTNWRIIIFNFFDEKDRRYAGIIPPDGLIALYKLCEKLDRYCLTEKEVKKAIPKGTNKTLESLQTQNLVYIDYETPAAPERLIYLEPSREFKKRSLEPKSGI